MFNPLVENVRELKDTDLENKIQELSRKYHMAARMMSGSVPMQIAVVLESYREELARRQAEAMKVLAQKSDKNLEGLIKKG
jgi:hypothetical protein